MMGGQWDDGRMAGRWESVGRREDGGTMAVSGMMGGWWDDRGQWIMDNSTPAILGTILGTQGCGGRENGVAG